MNHVFVVFAPSPLGDSPRIRQLIVRWVVKSNRARDHGAVERFGHIRDYRGRVDAAAQEGSQRHIASKANFDRFPEDAIQLFQQFTIRSSVRWRAWHIPILG